MALLFGILLLIGFGAAVDRAWENTKADFRASRQKAVKAREKEIGKSPLPPREKAAVRRRHRQGWWAREIGGGFPVIRTGWHTGWLAHQAAASHARARREEARLQGLRTRASFGTALPGYREERAQLEREISDLVLADPPSRPTLRAVRERAGAVVLPFRQRHDGPDAPPPPSYLGSPWMRDPDMPEPGPYATRRVDGQPGEDAATWTPDEAEGADQCHICGRSNVTLGHLADGSAICGTCRNNEFNASPTEPPTGGTSMSEMGYRQSVATAQQTAANAEQEAAAHSATATAIETMLDSHQADDMDSASIGELMDLAEASRAAAAAAARVSELATAYASNLQSRHENIASAHEEAPVDHAAHRDFYENA